MLDRVFKEKLTDVKLRKNTFIRLLHKMHSLSTVLFTKQQDGTSMDHSLEPVFAKLYMAEIKRKIAKTLTKYGLLKLYIGYLNDTFLLAKVKRYNFLKSNSFHNNLQFATFRLEQENFFWTYIVICTINPRMQDNILTLTAIRHGIQNRMVKHLYHDARKISSSKETFAFQINKIFIS